MKHTILNFAFQEEYLKIKKKNLIFNPAVSTSLMVYRLKKNSNLILYSTNIYKNNNNSNKIHLLSNLNLL